MTEGKREEERKREREGGRQEGVTDEGRQAAETSDRCKLGSDPCSLLTWGMLLHLCDHINTSVARNKQNHHIHPLVCRRHPSKDKTELRLDHALCAANTGV